MAIRSHRFFFWVSVFTSLVCLITIAVFSGFYHSWGKFKSMLVTACVVLMTHYLVGDPARFIILSILDAVWRPKDLKYATHIEVGHQTRLDYLNLRLKSLRAHFSISEKHRDENLNSKYREAAYDVWLYGKYFLYTMCMVLFKADETGYLTKERIQRIFSYNNSNYYGLLDMGDISNAYDFIKSSIINDFNAGDEMQNEWVHSEQTKLLGVVRLRQLRVTDVRHDRGFDPPFSKQFYLPGWKLPYRHFPYDRIYWRIHDPWIPKEANMNQNSFQTSNDRGHFRSYTMGNGYVSLLARSQQNSLVIVEFLRRNNWLNYNTSVLYIEFALYNTDVNYLAVCSLRLEQTPFGVTIPYVTVKTITLLEDLDQLTDLAIYLLILYIAKFIRFCKGLAVKLWNEPIVIRNIWIRVDLGIVLLNFIILILVSVRESQISSIFHHIENKSKMEFVELRQLTYVHKLTKISIGILLCLITLRLWKALEFSNVFQVFTHTMYLSWRAVASVAIVIVVLIIGFSIAVSAFNGDSCFNFSQLSQSIVTCTCFTFGYTHGINPKDLFHGGELIGAVFFAILVFVISVILINMFVSIINDFFCAAKNQLDTISGRRINILQFLYAEMGFYILCLQQLRVFRRCYHRKNLTVSENIMRKIQSIKKNRRKWEVTKGNAFILEHKMNPLDNAAEHEEFRYHQERMYTLGAILNTQIDVLQILSDMNQ